MWSWRCWLRGLGSAGTGLVISSLNNGEMEDTQLH